MASPSGIYIQACSVNHHHWIHGTARGAICVDFEWLCKADRLKLDQQAPLGHFRKQPSLWNLSHTENTLFPNRFNQQDKQQPYVWKEKEQERPSSHEAHLDMKGISVYNWSITTLASAEWQSVDDLITADGKPWNKSNKKSLRLKLVLTVCCTNLFNENRYFKLLSHVYLCVLYPEGTLTKNNLGNLD